MKNKEEQRQHLIDIMRGDEELGLYEEPKQETLEEAAKEWVNNRFTKQICGDESYPDIYASKEGIVESHILFAKWQAERMYSEEEVRELFKQYKEEFSIYRNLQILNAQFEEWFEQFKKK